MAIPQVHRSHPSPRTTPPPLPPHVLARAYTNHIIDIFGSARYPYPAPRSLWQSSLPSYIAYILSASGLPTEVGMSAMVLLFRYKDAMPGSVAYGEDAARLWVAAYVVAAKVVSDVDVDLEMRRRGVDGGGGGGGAGGQGIAHIPRRGMDFWCHVALQRFSVNELRKMELELCRILHWDVQVSSAAFECFRRMVYRECRVDMNEGVEEGEDGDEEEEEERHDEPHVHFLIRPRERVERPPPPPYYESERDVRVDETTTSDDQTIHTDDPSPVPPPRRRSTHTRIPRPRPCPPPQARARILNSSVAYGNALAGSEDRRRFGVIFDETAFPLEQIRVRKNEGGGDGGREMEKEKERSLFKVVRERIGQIVTRRPSLAGSI